VPWSQFDVAKLAPRLAAPALVVHDWDDRAVPWGQGAQIARQWPGAQLMTTRGLGHRRILEDEAVTRAAADFIAGREFAPVPAPLY
jgi:pimeloyl-ACP methyl ester carboxylesterase